VCTGGFVELDTKGLVAWQTVADRSDRVLRKHWKREEVSFVFFCSVLHTVSGCVDVVR